eukprot:scaffold84071_cov31-Tisochrysis_lutea.AAC.1
MCRWWTASDSSGRWVGWSGGQRTVLKGTPRASPLLRQQHLPQRANCAPTEPLLSFARRCSSSSSVRRSNSGRGCNGARRRRLS